MTFVEGRSHRKAWDLLFTCMSSRAVHVELVTSLTLSEFILAFTQFTDLQGPVNSPDLKPIENCWVILKQKVAAHNPSSLTHLKQVIKETWVKEITPEYCEKLCLSMPKHIQAVLNNNGLYTKY